MFGEEEKAWLEGLKEGDQVAMNVGSYGYPNYKIATITKITPTRIIKTDDGRVFNSNGRERGSTSKWGRNVSIEPVTATLFEKIERNHLITKLSRMKLEELPTELLQKIYKAWEDNNAHV